MGLCWPDSFRNAKKSFDLFWIFKWFCFTLEASLQFYLMLQHIKPCPCTNISMKKIYSFQELYWQGVWVMVTVKWTYPPHLIGQAALHNRSKWGVRCEVCLYPILQLWSSPYYSVVLPVDCIDNVIIKHIINLRLAKSAQDFGFPTKLEWWFSNLMSRL